MTAFFERFPEFVELDSRRVRGFSPVTFESLDNRHECSMPEWLCSGNSVLDLGSCLSATGHWALSHGATSYTGVEVQTEMVTTARSLMTRYWGDSGSRWQIHEQDLRQFLRSAREQGHRWDVIVMVGVIYAFLDTYTLLKEVAELCDYALILDSVYPINMTHPESSIIGVVRHQHINSAQPGVAYTGAGARPSPMALRVLMSTLGWHTPEGLLYPAPMQDPHTHDSYRTPVERVGRSGIDLPGRYLMRFFHTDANPLATVSDRVQQQDPGNQAAMLPNISVGTNAASWSFDPEVAKRFQREAETHIPDYERVLRLSLDLADLCLDGRDYPLIDVGSALGHTMDLFRDRGYTNVWGVDNSESMRAQSSQQERVYLSDKFPKNKDWHLVLANWTLHFMPNREQYLQDIFDTMVSGGILILSDKMSHTSIEEQLYHQFKRDNGVSQEEIDLKKQRLVGVLTTRPLEWYLQTLQAIGFEDPQVVNSRYMFHTIYARRP